MSLLSNIKTFYINFIIILSIFILDRLTKLYVIHLDKIDSGTKIFSSKFLNIYLIWNEGIAFGLFSSNESSLYNFLTLFILIIILVILYMMTKSSGLKKYSLLMILGGAIGNVFDRIIYKAVPDFIDFHVGNFHWFIFNVSDIFISVGVILMVILELTDKPKI
jgi:signal peptidase II|tara:strand:- start:707 stop:1195 length:489 start_codon:yes stop_codon:yes gene_type:complete